MMESGEAVAGETVTGEAGPDGGAPPAPEKLSPEAFDSVQQALRSRGVAAGLERLAEVLTDAGRYSRVFDALCMKKRFEMGLPLYAPNLSEIIPPEQRRPYEDFVIDVCRKVAELYMAAGDLAGAWPYLRTIGETETFVKALQNATLTDTNADALIDIAFQQDVSPAKGYEWILERFGTCQAVTILDQDQRHSPEVKKQCIALLVRRLHRDLTQTLRQEIQRREGAAPEDEKVSALLMGRPWLFEDHAYHIDSSHLSSTVRMALILPPGPDLELALQLAEYGTNLTEEWQYAGSPPFERTYDDCAIYLRALTGQDVDTAVEHFRKKITPDDPQGANAYCAQVLVNLLSRVGRHAEAVAAFEELKADADGPVQGCPSYVELCRLAGQPDRWADYARKHDDIVGFAAALASEQGAK